MASGQQQREQRARAARSGNPARAAAARTDQDRTPVRPRWGLVLLVVLVAAVVAAVLLLPGLGVGGGDPEPSDREVALQEEVAELERRDAERDLRQVESLTATGREATGVVSALVAQMRETLPPGQAPLADAPAPATTVAQWSDDLAGVRSDLGEAESAGTGVNIGREALAGALDALALAVHGYQDALASGGAARASTLERASESLDLGVRLWSVAANQIDELNVDAGLGHQHIHLDGTAPPDGAQDGDGAE